MKENKISKIIAKLKTLSEPNLTLVEEATNTCLSMQMLEKIKEANKKKVK